MSVDEGTGSSSAKPSAADAGGGEGGRYRWSQLSKGQLGRTTEWLASIEFMLHGFEVYSTEVDDRGVDLVVRKNGSSFDVQVKGLRPPKGDYTYFRKLYFELRPRLLAAVGVYRDGEPPDLYLIPALAWRDPSALLVDRPYGEGKTSPPEWGLSLTKKSAPLLAEFEFARQVLLLPAA
jgi:hypothetical protein